MDRRNFILASAGAVSAFELLGNVNKPFATEAINVACGALKRHAGDIGEVKRMYVAAECRGQGVAHRLFTLLEAGAKDRGCRLLMLETGPRQPEAIAFYERCGFSRTSPFGSYRDDPLSVFMRKPITTESAAA